jgi:hypothetical protein
MPPEQDEQSIDDLAGLLAANPAQGSAKDKAGSQGDGGQDHSPADDDELDGDHGTPEDDELTGDGEGDDEGTDDGEEGDDDGEGEGEGEGDEPSTEPLYTVKIDGKEQRVTLKEALAGYQRTQDYTRKTQEVAAKAQAAEAEATQLREAREQYLTVLTALQGRLSDGKDRSQEEWNQLRASDPDRYAVEYADFQRLEQQRSVVAAEKQRVEGEKQTEAKKALNDFIASEAQKLDAALPEWRDVAKRPAILKGIRDYGKEIGFSDKELDQAYDHRMVRMAHDAAQWRAHQAAQEKAKTKLREAPEVPAPRNRGSRTPAKVAERKAAQSKFNKTGSIDDAVPLLFKA